MSRVCCDSRSVNESVCQSFSQFASQPASQSVSKSVGDVCVCVRVNLVWCAYFSLHFCCYCLLLLLLLLSFLLISSENGLFVAYSKVISYFYWFQVLQFILLYCYILSFIFIFLFTTCLTKFIIYMCVMYV